MKRIVSLLPLLLCSLLAAAEFKLDPEKAQPGPLRPAIVSDALGNALRFKAEELQSTAARVPGLFDLRQGGSIRLEFQDDRIQTNPFPRLFEAGDISLHFQADPKNKTGDKILKLLLLGADKNNYRQIQFKMPYRDQAWHSAEITLDPVRKLAALRLDDQPEQLIPLPDGISLDKLVFILGAAKLEKSNRGFNGAIRNFIVSTPLARQLKNGAESAQVSPGVRHVTISALKGRHLAFPGLAKLPDGDLAVVFREGESHVCPYGRICIVYSKDGGQNWSAPVAIADTASDERDPSIQTLPDGRVLVTHGGWNSWMYYAGTADKFPGETNYIKQAGPDNFGGSHYLFSRDGGKTFGPPVKVPGFSPHGPAVLADGSLGQPSLGNNSDKRQVYFHRGSADASKWEAPVLIGESERDESHVRAVFEEPHTARLADGTLVTAIRVPSDGYMRISFSKDDGKTWSEPMKTPVRGFPQHLLPLKDGRLLATYGYRYFPMGVRACLSSDGGKTWDIDKEIILQNNGKNEDLGYPVSIEVAPGEIFTAYYHSDAKHDNCFIEGAFFKP